MNDVVLRLLRELPDTDKDRYDIAYGRGRAQARSVLLFGGMTIGLVAGALAVFLFDPTVGGGRRAQLAQRAKARLSDLQRTIDERRREGAVERETAVATIAALPRHEVRISPRSVAASVAHRTEATSDGTDRVPVAAGTAEG
jgi:gas vesicle protein